MKNCIHFEKCGGCNCLNKEYNVQIECKQKKMYELFSGLVKETPEFIRSPEIYYYRHKIQLPFGSNGKDITIGCYARDSHIIIDQKMCLLQNKDCSKIIVAVREWMRKNRLSVYDENRHSGFMRHLLIRRAYGTGEILVGFVTNGGKCKSTTKLAETLIELIEKEKLENSKVVGIIQNVNTRRTNVVLGEKEYIWWGRPYIKEFLGKWKFRIGIQTFFQVNPFQTPNLYNEVLKNIPEGTKVIDCFCGVGSISLWVSDKAAFVYGIEENPASIYGARAAARINGVRNIRFERADVSEAIFKPSLTNYDCAIFDPPRKGLEEKCINAVLFSSIKRIIYVSCNVETLLRDINLLSKKYSLISIKGFDMFPHTNHIESVAVLERKAY